MHLHPPEPSKRTMWDVPAFAWPCMPMSTRSGRHREQANRGPFCYIVCIYCTISIDSAWGVTCDTMNEILHMARLWRICDIEKNLAMSLSQACLKNLKLKQKCDLILWQPKDPLNVPSQTVCDMGQVMEFGQNHSPCDTWQPNQSKWYSRM